MGKENQTNLTAQLERRKRINRLKKGIVTFLTVWILIVSVLLVFLLVQVLTLQRQVAILAGNQLEIEKLNVYENSGDAGNEAISTEAGSPAASTAAAPTVEIATLDESNLAEPGDIPKVYLTFEAGPSGNTDAILDTLDRYGVKATFFVVGKEDEDSLAAYERIVDEGHTLGMNSYSHQNSELYRSVESFEADFTKLRDLLSEATGVSPSYYRFPSGSNYSLVDPEILGECIGYLNEEGVTYFDWNVSSGDATTQAYTKEGIVENVLNDVVKYKTSVVRLHDLDTKETTVEALPLLIERLQEIGAEILPIDETTVPIQYAVLEQNGENESNNEE